MKLIEIGEIMKPRRGECERCHSVYEYIFTDLKSVMKTSAKTGKQRVYFDVVCPACQHRNGVEPWFPEDINKLKKGQAVINE